MEQVRKLVVRTTHVSARVCETLNARSPAEMTGRGGYVLKDAQFEVSVEAREADNDKTGTVPRRKVTTILIILRAIHLTCLILDHSAII